jgi:RHS repeat-associated protein
LIRAINHTFSAVCLGSTRPNSAILLTDKKFTGQRLDQTGLYYYGARYYDAGIGRFISPDTIAPNPMNPQSLNRYSYCLNNPLRYKDPTGHWPEWLDQTINWAKWQWYQTTRTLNNLWTDLQPAIEIGSWAIVITDMAYCGASPFLNKLSTSNMGVNISNVWNKVTSCFSRNEPELPLNYLNKPWQIYWARDTDTGTAVHIGRTTDFETRAAAHLREKGITIKPIKGLENLSYSDARDVEDGCELLNKIHSISPLNPAYGEAVSRGIEILNCYPGLISIPGL